MLDIFCIYIYILEVSGNGGTPKSFILIGCSMKETLQLLGSTIEPPFKTAEAKTAEGACSRNLC